ncbi:MAG: thioredoxin-dependent thiol peroxidase [Sphaerochaetaceae bacterium]
MLKIGSKAPDIALFNDQGEKVFLSSYEGSYLVLYTYPRNNTPGCTQEACSFRDNSSAITALGAKVVGISTDTVASHKQFKEKYNLNFTLLADENHKMLEALGAWGEKISFGKKRMGTIRMTFLFDKEGILIKVWPKVSPKEHGLEIADYLKEL